jgi:hypothetical protein
LALLTSDFVEALLDERMLAAVGLKGHMKTPSIELERSSDEIIESELQESVIYFL